MKKILLCVLLILCCSGFGFAGQFENALKYAEQGDAKAQWFLGMLYGKGNGVTQDYKQAEYWYNKSAEQGTANKQFILGLMYKEGDGVTQDYKQAYIWFSLAAFQGDQNAVKYRDDAAKLLLPQQLVEAQELAGQMQQEIDNK